MRCHYGDERILWIYCFPSWIFSIDKKASLYWKGPQDVTYQQYFIFYKPSAFIPFRNIMLKIKTVLPHTSLAFMISVLFYRFKLSDTLTKQKLEKCIQLMVFCIMFCSCLSNLQQLWLEMKCSFPDHVSVINYTSTNVTAMSVSFMLFISWEKTRTSVSLCSVKLTKICSSMRMSFRQSIIINFTKL